MCVGFDFNQFAYNRRSVSPEKSTKYIIYQTRLFQFDLILLVLLLLFAV